MPAPPCSGWRFGLIWPDAGPFCRFCDRRGRKSRSMFGRFWAEAANLQGCACKPVDDSRRNFEPSDMRRHNVGSSHCFHRAARDSSVGTVISGNGAAMVHCETSARTGAPVRPARTQVTACAASTFSVGLGHRTQHSTSCAGSLRAGRSTEPNTSERDHHVLRYPGRILGSDGRCRRQEGADVDQGHADPRLHGRRDPGACRRLRDHHHRQHRQLPDRCAAVPGGLLHPLPAWLRPADRGLHAGAAGALRQAAGGRHEGAVAQLGPGLRGQFRRAP